MKVRLAALAPLCAVGAVLAQQPRAAGTICRRQRHADAARYASPTGRFEEFDGGPEWKERDHFDVEAVTSANPSQAEMLAMLRTLLADRFKLRAHTETRALPVYELLSCRDRTGVWTAFTRVADACPPRTRHARRRSRSPLPVRCGFTVQDGVLKGMGTLASIAGELGIAGRRTVDRTALAGVYSIELRWSPDNTAGLPADAPPEIFTAGARAAGAAPAGATAPTEVLVIEFGRAAGRELSDRCGGAEDRRLRDDEDRRLRTEDRRLRVTPYGTTRNAVVRVASPAFTSTA